MKLLVAAAAGLSLFAVLGASSNAERGVGVTLGQMAVTEKVKPGERYSLPQLGVLNTGSQAEEYRLGLTFVKGRPEHRPNESWVTFSPSRVVIQAGDSRMVDVQLRIPADAEPGNYFALLEASAGDAGADSTLAGAATKLTFTVAPSSWLETQKRRFDQWLDDSQPWTMLIPVFLLGVIALMTASKRVRFRLPFEPR
jgi:hypothetical protein